jgi:cytidylate kinase
MIITIDGLAASKKSPTAYLLADRMGFKHLNSGLLYRALALELRDSRWAWVKKALFRSNAWNDGLKSILDSMHFGDKTYEWIGSSVIYKTAGKGYEYKMRDLFSPKVTQEAAEISAYTAVRDGVEKCLRRATEASSAVIDGRDMGTVVFPKADVKFFFKASLTHRARWRHDYEGAQYGESYKSTYEALVARDEVERKEGRPPIVPADNAYIINVEGVDVATLAQRLDECYIYVILANREKRDLRNVPPCDVCEDICEVKDRRAEFGQQNN